MLTPGQRLQTCGFRTACFTAQTERGYDVISGNVWESNPAIRREADANGFEDRGGHQSPIRPHASEAHV